MNFNYYERKKQLRTRTTKESMTDQSAAAGTDINVVIGHMLATGEQPGEATPIYGDFTIIPEDLRSLIHTARGLARHRSSLPAQLRNMSLADLVALTPAKMRDILNPPAKPPAEAKETTK